MNMTHINDDISQVNIRTFNGSVTDLVSGHYKIKPKLNSCHTVWQWTAKDLKIQQNLHLCN